MTVGLSFTQADVNNKAASIAVDLRDALRQGRDFAAMLGNTQIVPNDTYLTNLGFTAAEVSTLRAAFADATTLYNVAYGTAAVPAVNNFMFNLQKLWGVTV